MNWDAIGAIAELLGAIGVIITLGYLATQIRANTRMMQSEARRAVREGSRTANLLIAGSEDLARIFETGLRDPAALEPAESTRFMFIMSELINPTEETFKEDRAGIGDIAELDQMSRDTLRFLRTPGGREYWRRFSRSYSGDFRAWVEQHQRE